MHRNRILAYRTRIRIEQVRAIENGCQTMRGEAAGRGGTGCGAVAQTRLPDKRTGATALGAAAPVLVRGYCPHPSNHLAFGFTACQMPTIINYTGENCDSRMKENEKMRLCRNHPVACEAFHKELLSTGITFREEYYTFTPSSRSFNNLSANRTADFIATRNRHNLCGLCKDNKF